VRGALDELDHARGTNPSPFPLPSGERVLLTST
jgi:hypothetical protein